MGAGKDLWNELVMQINKFDLSGWGALYATDAVLIDPTGRYEGREAIEPYLEESCKPFSDQRMETVLVIEDGDTTVAEWTWTASHTGSLAMPDGSEVPPTGKALVGAGVTIITVRDGKIASERDYFDSAAVMSQVAPLPGT